MCVCICMCVCVRMCVCSCVCVHECVCEREKKHKSGPKEYIFIRIRALVRHSIICSPAKVNAEISGKIKNKASAFVSRRLNKLNKVN